MKKFFINAILQPGAAILFCLIFGLPFVYVGFQTVEIVGYKNSSGEVTIQFARKHYWGLWQFDGQLEKVQHATLKTSLMHRIGTRRIRLTTGVFIESETEAVRLIAGSSSVDDQLKRSTVIKINDFIQDQTRNEYAHTVRVANIFGWFGLPFLVLGVLGLLGWPGSILKYWKNM